MFFFKENAVQNEYLHISVIQRALKNYDILEIVPKNWEQSDPSTNTSNNISN